MTNRDKLLKVNNLKGLEINALITEAHKYGDEYALLRKEIKHIEDSLMIRPTDEFNAYYEEAERIKEEVKKRLEPDEEISDE